MKTILITGGAGFIGSNFVRCIYENYPDYKIIVLDALTYAGNLENFIGTLKNNKKFSFCYGNVRNAELVDDLVSKSDIVFHFAAESHVARSIFDNMLFFKTDVLGSQTIANSVLKHFKKIEKFIHISSSEVYGTAMEEPMTEEHPLNPMTPYASAKAGADRLVYSYWATYDIPAVIIRPFNNYGSHQHLEKAIPRFITSAILSEPLVVHGNGENCRDWLYVEDFCSGLNKVLNTDINKIKGKVINMGTGKSISIISIAETILSMLGKPKSLIKFCPDRPGQVKKHVSSKEKALKLLGWKSATDFETGLEKTIKWYVDNRDWWKNQLWMRSIPITIKNGEVINF